MIPGLNETPTKEAWLAMAPGGTQGLPTGASDELRLDLRYGDDVDGPVQCVRAGRGSSRGGRHLGRPPSMARAIGACGGEIRSTSRWRGWVDQRWSRRGTLVAGAAYRLSNRGGVGHRTLDQGSTGASDSQFVVPATRWEGFGINGVPFVYTLGSVQNYSQNSGPRAISLPDGMILRKRYFTMGDGATTERQIVRMERAH